MEVRSEQQVWTWKGKKGQELLRSGEGESGLDWPPGIL